MLNSVGAAACASDGRSGAGGAPTSGKVRRAAIQHRRTEHESRRLLTDGLARLGLEAAPAAANFVLVDVADGALFRHALLPHGLVVRDCASFGLPACVRIACRLPEECRRLVSAVAQLGRG